MRLRGPAALDALRRQRSAGAEHVAALAPRRLSTGGDRGGSCSASARQTRSSRSKRWLARGARPAAGAGGDRAGDTAPRGGRRRLGRARRDCERYVTMAHLTREDRRRSIRALTGDAAAGRRQPRLRLRRGHRRRSAAGRDRRGDDGSRVCPGLYLVGEILDVDGRLGGFNFQWAWSSGWVAGQAIAKAIGAP